MIENKGKNRGQSVKEVFSKSSTLLIIRGIPGSGKTKLAQELSERIGKNKIALLDPDCIDTAGIEYSQFISDLAKVDPALDQKYYPYRYLMQQARDSLRVGKIVIWNQPFTDLCGLKRTVDLLDEYSMGISSSLHVVIIELEASEDLARQRIARRALEGGHALTEEKLTDFLRAYKSSSSLGYPTIQLDATIRPTELSEEVMAVLDNNG